MDIQQLCGWTPDQDETDKIVADLPQPLFGQVAELEYPKKDTFLFDFIRKVKGSDLDAGPQGIGDCVSWGWAGLADTLSCKQIALKLLKADLLTMPDPEDIDRAIARKNIVETFEEMSTEAIYALMRCEIGKQWNSNQDGAVGAWAAKAATLYGYLSRLALQRAGLSPKYDPKRAKLWGAKGLPDNLEPTAKEHPIKNVSLIRSWDEAAAGVVNYLNPIAICSNQGFSLKRDAQGFCKPQGTWYHCMKLLAVRFDRVGGLIVQSWGSNNPTGPTMFNQPTNSFWADADVIDRMLRQGDSFIASDLVNYTKEVDTPEFSWDH